jgi:AcrR family transcriptional regulator
MGRPRLTRARIVTTAVDLADREGLGAVTLRRLAARLGVHVTSLYNHVPTKEAVLDGMVERLVVEARLPTGTFGWEEWMRRFAAAVRAVAQAHPGAFEAFHHRPIQGTQAAEATEAALAAFHAGGFDEAAAYNAVKSTSVAVMGLVLDDLARLRTPDLPSDLGTHPPERFPHLRRIEAVAAQADTSTYLIDALVEGFAANLRGSKLTRRRAGGARHKRTSFGPGSV